MKQLTKTVALIAVLLFWPTTAGASAQDLKAALSQALNGTQASAVVLDWNTGAIIASAGRKVRSNPGSTIKPLLLNYALEHGIVQPETKVYCRRNLRINKMGLQCTHPTDRLVLDAQTALAESCNTWFAEMGKRFSGQQLESALQKNHLQHRSMNEAGVEQRQFAVLGLRSVTASAEELGRAYVELLTHLSHASPVWLGLVDAVDYGMANPAAVAGVAMMGKTGTAQNPGETWTHGWFAGGMPGQFIVVVYIPHGDGGDAARLAGGFVRAATPGTVRQ